MREAGIGYVACAEIRTIQPRLATRLNVTVNRK
jgi:hypothetical protein